MHQAPATGLQHIEALLGKIERLTLPPNWPEATARELGLDSVDLIELQLELETVCGVALFDDAVTESDAANLSMKALGARVDALLAHQT